MSNVYSDGGGESPSPDPRPLRPRCDPVRTPVESGLVLSSDFIESILMSTAHDCRILRQSSSFGYSNSRPPLPTPTPSSSDFLPKRVLDGMARVFILLGKNRSTVPIVIVHPFFLYGSFLWVKFGRRSLFPVNRRPPYIRRNLLNRSRPSYTGVCCRLRLNDCQSFSRRCLY